jgi:hypothetical protein
MQPSWWLPAGISRVPFESGSLHVRLHFALRFALHLALLFALLFALHEPDIRCIQDAAGCNAVLDFQCKDI